MSRFLIIILLLILPLQATLAAADLCCGYGTEARHEQCVAVELSGVANDPVHAGSNIDVHCASCVLAATGYLPGHSAVPAWNPVDRTAVTPFELLPFASYFAPRPERPQWSSPV